MYTPSIYQFIPNSFGLNGSLISILPDLIGVVNGLKPCASGVVKIEEINSAKEICRRNGLKIDFSNFKLLIDPKSNIKIKLSANYNGEGWRQVFISKSEKILKQAKQAHFEHTLYKGKTQIAPRNIIKNYGKILGYPDCCIEHLIQCDYDRKFDNAVSGACYNTKIFHHELNNLAYFRYYIPYFPCSYDCKESLKYTEKLKKKIKKIEPDIYNATEKYLKFPYLFIDYNLGVVFDGVVEKKIGAILYSDFDIVGPVNDDLSLALRGGNKCRVFNDKIEIIYNLKTLKVFPKSNKEKKFIVTFE